MRFPDTRSWALTSAALLLASACQTAPQVPADETETGNGDGDGDTGDGDGDPTGDGDPDTGDGDGDSTDGPNCGAPLDPCACNLDTDCEIGEVCSFDSECVPFGHLDECPAPQLVELLLPDEAQGPVLDLELVDINGDNVVDELMLLKPGELLVLDSTQLLSSSVVDPLAEELAFVDADGDGHLDVILTSSTPDHGSRLLGNGDGTFAAAVSLALPALLQPQGLRWPSGDAQAVLALDLDTRSSVLLTDLASDPPSVNSFPDVGLIDIDLDAVRRGDLDDDGDDEVLLMRDCVLSYRNSDGDAVSQEAWPSQLCPVTYVGAFPSDDPSTLVFAESGAETVMLVFNHMWADLDPNGGGWIAGSVDDVASVPWLGLILVGPDATRLVRKNESGGVGCIAELEGLPIAERVITGNFTDNAGEFVLLGQDQISAWVYR